MILLLVCIFVQHVCACCWIIIGQEENLDVRGSWFTPSMADQSEVTIYV
jgi:hypothetical protein